MKDDALIKPRVGGLDAARGLAVLAMFAFHFIWDLGHFGYIDAEIPYSKGVKLFGHAIAIAFLFIAGISLVLAHEKVAPWRGFWRRILIVGGAAALVSAGTYVAFPERFVFFGILHCIAAASLLAAPFLFLPWQAAALGALAAGLAPLFLSNSLFNAPLLYWVGLSTIEPTSNDYRPLLPWAGALLAGVAAMQAARAFLPLAGSGLRELSEIGRPPPSPSPTRGEGIGQRCSPSSVATACCFTSSISPCFSRPSAPSPFSRPLPSYKGLSPLAKRNARRRAASRRRATPPAFAPNRKPREAAP